MTQKGIRIRDVTPLSPVRYAF